jgi:hypothetical protein
LHHGQGGHHVPTRSTGVCVADHALVERVDGKPSTLREQWCTCAPNCDMICGSHVRKNGNARL